MRALDIKPQRVWIAGHSETVLACREKRSGYFSEYYGNQKERLTTINRRSKRSARWVRLASGGISRGQRILQTGPQLA